MSDLLMSLLQMGFSFACTAVCMWYVYHTDNSHREEMEATRRAHSDESKEFQTALNNMNVTLQKLTDKLEEVIKYDSK